MNYTKPQVEVIGNATHVIESIPHNKPFNNRADSLVGQNPAYDLDE